MITLPPPLSPLSQRFIARVRPCVRPCVRPWCDAVKQRAATRRPVAALLFLAATGTGVFLPGCTSPSGSAPTARSARTADRTADSSSPTLSTPAQTDWGAVFNSWWQRYNAPTPQRTPVAARYTAFPLQEVTATHPALQLIAALQRGGGALPDLSTLRDGPFLNSPVPLPHLLPGSRGQRNGSASNGFGSDGFPELPPPAGLPSWMNPASSLDLPRNVIAASLDDLQDAARGRELSALDDFFNGVADYQQGVRNERETALRAAIEDRIAVSRSSLLAQLSPVLPSEAVLLEITNLRLKLLDNVATPEDERLRAEQRLQFLEGQWAVMLREQEAERLRELQRLIEERPRRLRAEGEVEIRRILTELETRDKNLRVNARNEQKERIAVDFNDSDNRLGIVQPRFTPSARAKGTVTGANDRNDRRDNNRRNTDRTIQREASSLNRLTLPSFEAIPLPADATPEERAAFNAQLQRVRRQVETDTTNWRSVVKRRERDYKGKGSGARPSSNRIDKQSGNITGG